jgi:hypothetical protein
LAGCVATAFFFAKKKPFVGIFKKAVVWAPAPVFKMAESALKKGATLPSLRAGTPGLRSNFLFFFLFFYLFFYGCEARSEFLLATGYPALLILATQRPVFFLFIFLWLRPFPTGA